MVEIIIFLVAMMIWCVNRSSLSDGLLKSTLFVVIILVSLILCFFDYMCVAILIVFIADFLIERRYI